MVTNQEIKIMLENRKKGLNSDGSTGDGLNPEEILKIMEVPYEWTGNSYLFDFGSISIEMLSDYVNYIFKQLGYHLEEGTPDNGIYLMTNLSLGYALYNLVSPVYKFKVEIYFNGEKTYLNISEAFIGWQMSSYKIIYGKNYLNSELNRIVNKIKYLKPYVAGYLICNQCGGYFEIQEGESPDDYDRTCECGGTLEYISNLKQPDEESVEKNRTSKTKLYLNILIIISFICLILLFLAASVIPNSQFLMVIIMPLFVLILVLLLVSTDY